MPGPGPGRGPGPKEPEPGARSQEPGATHGLAHVKFLEATRSRLSVAAVAEKPGAACGHRGGIEIGS